MKAVLRAVTTDPIMVEPRVRPRGCERVAASAGEMAVLSAERMEQ